MKALVVYARTYREGGKKPLKLPLNILYISGYLEKSGIENLPLDLVFHEEAVRQSLILEESPDYLILYVDASSRRSSIELIKGLQQQPQFDGKTIVCGPDMLHYCSYYLELGVDVCVWGEAQETITELVNTMDIPMNPFLDHVAGISYKNGLGDITTTTPRVRAKDTDARVWPNRKKLDHKVYDHAEFEVFPSGTYAVNSDDYLTMKTPGQVISEMAYIQQTFAVNSFRLVMSEGDVTASWIASFVQALKLQEQEWNLTLEIECSKVGELPLTSLKEVGLRAITLTHDSSLSSKEKDLLARAAIQQLQDADIVHGIRVVLPPFVMKIAHLESELKRLKHVLPDFIEVSFSLTENFNKGTQKNLIFEEYPWELLQAVEVWLQAGLSHEQTRLTGSFGAKWKAKKTEKKARKAALKLM